MTITTNEQRNLFRQINIKEAATILPSRNLHAMEWYGRMYVAMKRQSLLLTKRPIPYNYDPPAKL